MVDVADRVGAALDISSLYVCCVASERNASTRNVTIQVKSSMSKVPPSKSCVNEVVLVASTDVSSFRLL